MSLKIAMGKARIGETMNADQNTTQAADAAHQAADAAHGAANAQFTADQAEAAFARAAAATEAAKAVRHARQVNWMKVAGAVGVVAAAAAGAYFWKSGRKAPAAEATSVVIVE